MTIQNETPKHFIPEGKIEGEIEYLIATIEDDVLLRQLQLASISRANRWHGNFRDWSGLEWAGAMCGEAGEAANVAKKIRRWEQALAGNDKSQHPVGGEGSLDGLKHELAKECADTVCYAVLLCARYGLDLASAVREVFNNKSEAMGFPERV